MQVAVLGMGRMGRAMAGRLLEGGHQVAVWNRSAGRADELVARGARSAPTVADAVAPADAVITMLADDDAVRAVALGPDGVVAALAPGAVYADASTVSPGISEELAAAAGPGRFVAMPVLGAPSAVAGGAAVYLAGGDPEAVDHLQPVLASLTATVRRYPAAHLATTAKLASNFLLLAGVVALAEAFTVGRSGGLSEEQLVELLGESPLVAPALRNRFEGVRTGRQDPWWSPALGAKDARLAVAVAAGAGTELPLGTVVRDLYREAAERDTGDGDITAVADHYPR